MTEEEWEEECEWEEEWNLATLMKQTAECGQALAELGTSMLQLFHEEDF